MATNFNKAKSMLTTSSPIFDGATKATYDDFPKDTPIRIDEATLYTDNSNATYGVMRINSDDGDMFMLTGTIGTKCIETLLECGMEPDENGITHEPFYISIGEEKKTKDGKRSYTPIYLIGGEDDYKEIMLK